MTATFVVPFSLKMAPMYFKCSTVSSYFQISVIFVVIGASLMSSADIEDRLVEHRQTRGPSPPLCLKQVLHWWIYVEFIVGLDPFLAYVVFIHSDPKRTVPYSVERLFEIYV